MSHDSQATVIGFIGVTVLLIAFLLNLVKLLRSEGLAYGSLNIIGASLACYSSYLISFMPFVILEGVWAVAALVAVVRMVISGRRARAP